ncbi:MAG: transcription elongation factor GreA [Halothiobacillaceae bacterium]|nr:MAG: transcription elongation factor GreA [Halothiobacillaceae bacterium]
MNRVPMTAAGAAKLEDELKQLRSVDRPRIIQAIAEARELGDLKENAEYHAAREEQSFVEGRIKEIEHKLSLAQVIDVLKLPNTGKVIFGCTVVVLEEESGEEITYKLVGDDEADIKQNLISVHSPLARALIGKHIGDTIIFRAPAGERTYEVLEVHHI